MPSGYRKISSLVGLNFLAPMINKFVQEGGENDIDNFMKKLLNKNFVNF